MSKKILTTEVRAYIHNSVLCWLATSSKAGLPNVSPKEIFSAYLDQYILIAHIASPQSVKNIRENPQTCVSFIDILRQKGYQCKGTASLVDPKDDAYDAMSSVLEELTQGLFPFRVIICIDVDTCKPIIAPRYQLFPDTTEEQQIESAKRQYNL